MSESSSTKPPRRRREGAKKKPQPAADPLAGDWSEGLPGPAHPHGLPLPVPIDVTAPDGIASLRAGQLQDPPLDGGLQPPETPWSTPVTGATGEGPAGRARRAAPAVEPLPEDALAAAIPLPESAIGGDAWGAPTASAPGPAVPEDWAEPVTGRWSSAPAANEPSVSATTPAGPERIAEPAASEWTQAAEPAPATEPPTPVARIRARKAVLTPPAPRESLTEEPVAPDWTHAPKRVLAPPAPGESLTEEPPPPAWTHAPKPVLAPTAPGESLTEEPPPPAWMQAPRPVLAPLPAGESLSVDDPDGAPPSAPPSLQIVPPQPEELEDPNLLVPVDDVKFTVPPLREPPTDMIVPGEQRVAVHTRAGRTRRGTVMDLDLSSGQFALQPQGGGSTELVARKDVKAIFFMLAPGEHAPAGDGPLVRVTFEDSRTIDGRLVGGSDPNGFFLVPTDAQRTNTRRIYVARAAVANVAQLG